MSKKLSPQKERCSELVYDRDLRQSSRCSKWAVEDGFCRIHTEAYIQAREKKAQEKYEKKADESVYGKLSRANKRIEELEAAITAAFDCGMVPKTSAREGGAAKHSAQVQAADMLRDVMKSQI